MSLVAFSPDMLVIDPRSGRLTRDGALLIQFMVNAVNGAGAVLTNDGEQIVTGKTISGNNNTLTDIAATSLRERTGDGSSVVTAAAPGTTNFLAVWANGDLADGPQAGEVVTFEEGDQRYVSIDGSAETTGPVNLASYAVAGVPAAAAYPNSLIYVSDETGGATVAFSDGTNWRRVQDRAVIS